MMLKGCNFEPGGAVLQGRLVTRPNLDSSFIAIGTDPLPEDSEVSGGTVFLSLDKSGATCIESTRTLCDENGRYSIDISRVPPSQEADGYYYLVVEVPTYSRFVGHVSLRRLSPYRHHRVYLKHE